MDTFTQHEITTSLWAIVFLLSAEFDSTSIAVAAVLMIIANLLSVLLEAIAYIKARRYD